MSIRDELNRKASGSPEQYLWGATGSVALSEMGERSCLSEDVGGLAGRTVLLATQDQLAAALALIELDGIVKRVLLCPPETAPEHFPLLVTRGEVDTVVSDAPLPEAACLNGLQQVRCSAGALRPSRLASVPQRSSEWVLLSSGTTGAPKMILHSLQTLTGAMTKGGPSAEEEIVWGTFYDIRRYGGLQIFLRAVMGHRSLVLSQAGETPAAHLARLAQRGVTHLSGTPSHWRRALMTPGAREIRPRYVRLSGEIADGPILSALHAFYPQAALGHAFASTESGVTFEVNDGQADFPVHFVESTGGGGGVELKIRNDSLHIRSNRVAARYLDGEHGALADSDGFVDTGDIVERRGDRYFFLGRRNGVINVGGLKVYPEEVEATICRHPSVRMCAVRPRNNPITGALVAAEVMLKEVFEPQALAERLASIRTEILELCRRDLAPHKVPASVRYVTSLPVAAAGKLARHHA